MKKYLFLTAAALLLTASTVHAQDLDLEASFGFVGFNEEGENVAVVAVGGKTTFMHALVRGGLAYDMTDPSTYLTVGYQVDNIWSLSGGVNNMFDPLIHVGAGPFNTTLNFKEISFVAGVTFNFPW